MKNSLNCTRAKFPLLTLSLCGTIHFTNLLFSRPWAACPCPAPLKTQQTGPQHLRHLRQPVAEVLALSQSQHTCRPGWEEGGQAWWRFPEFIPKEQVFRPCHDVHLQVNSPTFSSCNRHCCTLWPVLAMKVKVEQSALTAILRAKNDSLPVADASSCERVYSLPVENCDRGQQAMTRVVGAMPAYLSDTWSTGCLHDCSHCLRGAQDQPTRCN